jgi:hypothetical protein
MSQANFSVSAVATAPSPAASGLTLVVTAGHGARLPATPFQATIWPAGDLPTLDNAEIITVTGIATDTLTIVRAQEGSAARTVVVGDIIAATLTKQMLQRDLDAWDLGIRKSADQTVSNNATLQSDTELTCALLAASVYEVDLFLIYSGNTNTGLYKWQFLYAGSNVVDTAQMHGWYLGISSSGGVIAARNPIGAIGALSGADSVWPNAAISLGTLAGAGHAKFVARARFFITTNGAGTLTFQFANNAAGGGRESRTCVGSLMRVRKLP